MASGDLPPHIPHVTDDDFLATFLEGDDTERWTKVAHDQPELARTAEQQANQLRRKMELGELSPMEFQAEVINLVTFVVSAIGHAIETQRAEGHLAIPSEPTDPPLSA